MAKRQTVDDPEVEMVDVIVDGEVVAQVPKGEVAQIGNLGDWRKKLTHEADENAAVRRANAAGLEEVATGRASLAREREIALNEPAARTEAKIEAVEEAGISTQDWPNPADDPEGFSRKLAEGLQQAANAGYQKASRELSGKVDARLKQAETASAVTAAGQRVFAQNQRTVDAYIDRMKEDGTPLNAEQTRDLIAHMDTSLRLPKAGMAERDPASGKIIFTEEAVAAADHVVRFDYYQTRAEEKGVQETLRRTGSPDINEVVRAPASSATPKEKSDFALTLNPKQQQRYIEDLPEAELEEVMKHFYKEAEADGATSLMRAGVE